MKQDNFKLDSRNVEDIQNQIKDLAASYVPEWNFTTSNPDIGSVLALLFASQMEKNINRFNHMPEKYRTELVNLMDISPLPAKPAETTILMRVASEADEDVYIPKGSKFLADTEESKIVFETAFPVYLTPSSLKTMFMTSGMSGRVLPLMGGLVRKNYVETEDSIYTIKKLLSHAIKSCSTWNNYYDKRRKRTEISSSEKHRAEHA